MRSQGGPRTGRAGRRAGCRGRGRHQVNPNQKEQEDDRGDSRAQGSLDQVQQPEGGKGGGKQFTSRMEKEDDILRSSEFQLKVGEEEGNGLDHKFRGERCGWEVATRSRKAGQKFGSGGGDTRLILANGWMVEKERNPTGV